MTKYYKLGLYGDSLSLARPGVVDNTDRYLYKLIEYFHTKFPDSISETIQRSKASITAPEIFSILYHDSVYYNWEGDVCIFHLGIVDCAPRPIDTVLRERIGRLPEFIKLRIIKYLHNNRRNILLKGKAKYITSEEDFISSLNQAFNLSSKMYNKIFVINICPTNQETEYKSPGLTDSIKKYNDLILKQVKLQNPEKFQLVNIYDYIFERFNEIDKYILKEDGHHITPLTHSVIYQKIISGLYE